MSRFIELMEERNWIYNLPPDALESHHFEEMGTQITAAPTQRAFGKSSPRKGSGGENKENKRPSPRRAKIGERVLLKLITRDILNEMTNGAY